MWETVVTLLALLSVAGSGNQREAAERGSGCAVPRGGEAVIGDAVAVRATSAPDESWIGEALAQWERCVNYAADFPRLFLLRDGDVDAVEGRGATSVLEVVWVRSNSGDERCGAFRGRRLTLWSSARTASGTIRSCGSVALNLAHELGHALGLADSAEHDACDGTIMAALSARNLHRRTVSEEECRLAGRRWITFAEWQSHPQRPAEPAAAPAWPAELLRSAGPRFEPQ